jgi:hypothetical protein
MPTRASDIAFQGHTVTHRITERTFSVLGDQAYRFELLPVGIIFEVNRLRREHHNLTGELRVSVNGNFPAAKTLGAGVLMWGETNFSAIQTRQQRAKFMAQRSEAEDIDWYGILEDFAIRLEIAEREGTPEVDLLDVPKPGLDRWLNFSGVELPIKHPTVIFGDGGSAKSYFALYWAGLMSRQGLNVLYVDWEWTKDEHRERIECLFGSAFPSVKHLEAYRPLRDEADRIKRIVFAKGIHFVIFDSVGIACGGDPSGSEACMTYWQAVRQLGVGSLHIAHVTKGFNGKSDDQKPFGSTFWHNMARATYNIKGEPQGDRAIAVGIYARKNQWGHKANASFKLAFGERTTIEPIDLNTVAALEEGLPISDRIETVLTEEPRTRAELAQVLGIEIATIQKIVYRDIRRGRLLELPGKKGHQPITIAPSRKHHTGMEF